MPAWAGGWDHQFGQPHALINQFGSNERVVARLSALQGNTKFAEIAAALAAGGPGGNTVYSYKQVSARQAEGMNQGGQVPITEYFVVPQRTLTIADREWVQAQFRPKWAPDPYPVDKSGNSGGGFLGTVNR